MDQLDPDSTSKSLKRRTEVVSPSPTERVKNSRWIEPDTKEDTKRRKLSSASTLYSENRTDAAVVPSVATTPASRSLASKTIAFHIPDFDVTTDQCLSQLAPKYAPELFVGLDLPGGVPVNFRWINSLSRNTTVPAPFSRTVIIYGEYQERGRIRHKPIVHRDLPSGEQQLLLTVPYELPCYAIETRKDMRRGFFSEQVRVNPVQFQAAIAFLQPAWSTSIADEKEMSVMLACGSGGLSIEVMALAATYLGLKTRWNVFNIAESIVTDPLVYEEWKQDLEYPDIDFINEYVSSWYED